MTYNYRYLTLKWTLQIQRWYCLTSSPAHFFRTQLTVGSTRNMNRCG